MDTNTNMTNKNTDAVLENTMLLRRNAIEISVKGLVLAVVVIIALVLSAISLYMITRSKGTINDGNTQFSELMSEYSEISVTLYDGLHVSGDKVVDVISDCAGTLKDGVSVLTLENAKSDTLKTYKTASAYTDEKYSRSDSSYINTSGTFVGAVTKNDNGMVTNITFTQIN